MVTFIEWSLKRLVEKKTHFLHKIQYIFLHWIQYIKVLEKTQIR
jgi:hypothetical protein